MDNLRGRRPLKMVFSNFDRSVENFYKRFAKKFCACGALTLCRPNSAPISDPYGLHVPVPFQDDDYEEGLSDEEEELVRGLAKEIEGNLEEEDGSNPASNNASRATTPLISAE